MIPINGINKKNRHQKIIVSLTSYSKRFSELNLVIKSLLNQKMKPDMVILYLGTDSDVSDLPCSLLKLRKYGLTIVDGCDDLKPHKKYYFAMQEYPDDIIITVDDDCIYDRDLIKNLVETHNQFPDAVIARRVNRMRFDEKNNRLLYNQWDYEVQDTCNSPDYYLLATGVGGCLYPPHKLDNQLFNINAIRKTCLLTDDLWLKYIELKSKVAVVKSQSKVKHPLTLEYSAATGLAKLNVLRNNNDEAMDKIEEYMNTTFYDLIINCINKE